MFEKFEEYLKAKGASERTLRTYIGFIKAFFEYTKKSVEQITLEDVIAYLASLKGKSPYTLWTASHALKSFFKAIKSNVNPDLIPVPERSLEERQIVVIPEDVIKQTALSLPIKYGAMLALTYECGLRVSEIARLRQRDLDLNNNVCYVRRVKGSVSSYVPIVAPWVIEILSTYVASLSIRDPNAPLFPGKKLSFMNYAAVSRILKMILKMMGYPNARPHDIRHSRATHLWRHNLDVVSIAKVLGHKQLASTLRYAHVVVEDLRKKLMQTQEAKEQ